jgi:hypothetical protein
VWRAWYVVTQAGFLSLVGLAGSDIVECSANFLPSDLLLAWLITDCDVCMFFYLRMGSLLSKIGTVYFIFHISFV